MNLRAAPLACCVTDFNVLPLGALISSCRQSVATTESRSKPYTPAIGSFVIAQLNPAKQPQILSRVPTDLSPVRRRWRTSRQRRDAGNISRTHGLFFH